MPVTIASDKITFTDNTSLSTGFITINTNQIVDSAVTAEKINNGAIIPSKLSQPFTLTTKVDAINQTSIDFINIPSWVKRITVMVNGLKTSGTSVPIIQLGDSNDFKISGYTGIATNQGSTAAAYAYLSTGFALLQSTVASVVMYGHVIIVSMGNNIWTAFGGVGRTDNSFLGQVQGAVTLNNTLTRVRLTTVNGSDTFTAGAVNIMYEG